MQIYAEQSAIQMQSVILKTKVNWKLEEYIISQ
jgi:hypothetical protein